MFEQNVNEIPGDRAKVSIYGQPGTGKTTLAGSMGLIGKVAYLYSPGDEGIQSLRDTPYSENVFVHRVTSMNEQLEAYNEIRKSDQFVSVVWDTVDAYSDVVIGEILKLKPEEFSLKIPQMEISQWGVYKRHMMEFFRQWFALASHRRKHPMNVIMVAHAKMGGFLDEAKEKKTIVPALPAGGAAPFIEKGDFTLYTSIVPSLKGGMEYQIHLKPTASITSKQHIGNEELSDKIPATVSGERFRLPELLKKLQINIGGTAEEDK